MRFCFGKFFMELYKFVCLNINYCKFDLFQRTDIEVGTLFQRTDIVVGALFVNNGKAKRRC